MTGWKWRCFQNTLTHQIKPVLYAIQVDVSCTKVSLPVSVGTCQHVGYDYKCIHPHHRLVAQYKRWGECKRGQIKCGGEQRFIKRIDYTFCFKQTNYAWSIRHILTLRQRVTRPCCFAWHEDLATRLVTPRLPPSPRQFCSRCRHTRAPSWLAPARGRARHTFYETNCVSWGQGWGCGTLLCCEMWDGILITVSVWETVCCNEDRVRAMNRCRQRRY